MNTIDKKFENLLKVEYLLNFKYFELNLPILSKYY